MNLTITGKIWGMPVNFIGQPTQDSSIKITDWLPLAVVIVGGILTYYTAIVLERRKRKFELKREIYFEAVELFSAISLFEQEIEIDLERAHASTVEDYYELDEEFKARWENWVSSEKVIGKLILLKYKLKLCETPDGILENIEGLKNSIPNIRSSTDISVMDSLIIENLIPALSKEISKESAWQLWR